LHLNDTLVAPIWNKRGTGCPASDNRTVWIPPGVWQDAWTGASVTGPANMSVTQPVDRIPMWHRKGGLTVLSSAPTLRVDDQDWSELTLEAFPHTIAAGETATTQRQVFAKQNEHTGPTPPPTVIEMHTTADTVNFTISAGAGTVLTRAWVIRVHLEPGTRVIHGTVNKDTIGDDLIIHLPPVSSQAGGNFSPFGGKGARPAPRAGDIVQLRLPPSSEQRSVQLTIARA